MSVDLFGTLRHAGHIKAAAREALDVWLPRYLEEIVDQDEDGLLDAHGITELPDLRSFSTPQAFDRFPEEQLPACVMVTTGTATRPEKYEEGYHRASYSLGIAVVVSANTMEVTDLLADVYAAAVKGSILQHRSLNRDYLAVYWVGDDNTVLPEEDRRSIGAGMNEFSVQVDNVVSTNLGPAEAAPPIDEGWPVTAEDVEATVVTPLEE